MTEEKKFSTDEKSDAVLAYFDKEKRTSLKYDEIPIRYGEMKIENSEKEEILEKLEEDGYINKYVHEFGLPTRNYSIKTEGRSFIGNGGYCGLAKEKLLDIEVKKTNIESYKLSKRAVCISIITLVVSSIISLLALYLNKDKVDIEELKELKQKQDIMTNEVEKQKTTVKTIEHKLISIEDSCKKKK